MEKKENINSVDKEMRIAIVNMIIGMSFVMLADLSFYFIVYRIIYIPSNTIKLSIFLSIILFTLVTAISKKSHRATIIISVFSIVLNILNAAKIKYTAEPIYFSDIKFVAGLGSLGGLVDIPNLLKYLIPVMIVITILLLLLIYISKKNSFEIKNIKLRIAIIVIDLILLVLLFIPNRFTKELYLKIFFNTDKYVDFNSYVTTLEYYERNGFVAGMYGAYINNIFSEPKGYDEKKLDELLNSTIESNNKNLGKPNIVIIFSEAFWDITQLEEVEFNQDVVSNFHNLKNEGKFVNLISPTYGGMSENVAFEILTGSSMNYFPKGYIPIMSYYDLKSSKSSPSIVKTLKNNGYNTRIIFGRDYYLSEKNYRKMGFDDYREFYQTMEEKDITDDFLMNYIIENLKNKSDERILYVAESIEAHMPFSKDKYDNYDISIEKSDLKENNNEVLRTYAQCMYNADKSLKKLYDFIQDYDEPTIIIFLGDHLPFLYNYASSNIISILNYFNTDDELLNFYRLYNTQALILSNFDMKDININEYCGTNLLLTSIVNQMDIELDDYYKWLYSTKDILPATNRYISLDKDGNRYSTNRLDGELRDMYTLREQMQYKMFYK